MLTTANIGVIRNRLERNACAADNGQKMLYKVPAIVDVDQRKFANFASVNDFMTRNIVGRTVVTLKGFANPR